jgi:hypothetical protein
MLIKLFQTILIKTQINHLRLTKRIIKIETDFELKQKFEEF